MKNPSPVLMSCREVTDFLGLSRQRIYQLMGQRRFPLPLKIGKLTVRWLRSEVEEWLESRNRSPIKDYRIADRRAAERRAKRKEEQAQQSAAA